MEYVIFENDGEIDPRLITTFGVNVKDNDDAIGFFGTGLKYALSILIREGCEVWIQSGTEQHQFGKQTISLRGKPFEFVTMDNEPLGFTTEVGKKWELWMAYRELYCNATDEKGGTSQSKAMPEPQEGFTRVIVKGDRFSAVADEHGRYFLIGDAEAQGNLVNRHSGHSTGVYYRRVLVGKLSGKPTMFTYNLATRMELTEDRTLKYPFMASHAIARSISLSDDADYIRKCVLAADVFHESELHYDAEEEPSAAFMAVMAQCVRDKISAVNHSARVKYEKHCKTKSKPDLVELNSVEQAALDKARAFCEKIGFHIEYPIVTVESLGSDIYGMASDETIFLAHRAFMVGTKCLAGTLIEEFIHLKHGHADFTRGFQNYILDRLHEHGRATYWRTAMSADLPVVVPEVRADSSTLLATIARVASDPAANMDNIERLFALHQTMVKQDAEREFNAAMSRAQADMQPVLKTKDNTQTQSKYANLAAIIDIIKPVYTAEGFSISFDTDASPIEKYLRVVAIVAHRAGHSRTYHLDLPADDVGIKGSTNKTAVHATGSTNTYARRYLTCMVFNIQTVDDTDGNSATAGALGNLSAARRKVIIEIAANVRELMGADKAFDAYGLIETSGLDSEEKIALWSLFDSKVRSTLKAMRDTERKTEKITGPQHKRIEARIKELAIDRDSLKDWAKDKFGKEHFTDLNPDEYRTLDEYVESFAPKAAAQSTPRADSSPAVETAAAAPTDADIIKTVGRYVEDLNFDLARDAARSIADEAKRLRVTERIAKAQEAHDTATQP